MPLLEGIQFPQHCDSINTEKNNNSVLKYDSHPTFSPSPPLPLFPFPLHPLLLPRLVCLQKAMAIHSILFTLALRTLGRESSQILIKVGGRLKHFMEPEFPESFGNARRSLCSPSFPHNEERRFRSVRVSTRGYPPPPPP